MLKTWKLGFPGDGCVLRCRPTRRPKDPRVRWASVTLSPPASSDTPCTEGTRMMSRQIIPARELYIPLASSQSGFDEWLRNMQNFLHESEGSGLKYCFLSYLKIIIQININLGWQRNQEAQRIPIRREIIFSAWEALSYNEKHVHGYIFQRTAPVSAPGTLVRLPSSLWNLSFPR